VGAKERRTQGKERRGVNPSLVCAAILKERGWNFFRWGIPKSVEKMIELNRYAVWPSLG
jgi:hypothetical protein